MRAYTRYTTLTTRAENAPQKWWDTAKTSLDEIVSMLEACVKHLSARRMVASWDAFKEGFQYIATTVGKASSEPDVARKSMQLALEVFTAKWLTALTTTGVSFPQKLCEDYQKAVAGLLATMHRCSTAVGAFLENWEWKSNNDHGMDAFQQKAYNMYTAFTELVSLVNSHNDGVEDGAVFDTTAMREVETAWAPVRCVYEEQAVTAYNNLVTTDSWFLTFLKEASKLSKNTFNTSPQPPFKKAKLEQPTIPKQAAEDIYGATDTATQATETAVALVQNAEVALAPVTESEPSAATRKLGVPLATTKITQCTDERCNTMLIAAEYLKGYDPSTNLLPIASQWTKIDISVARWLCGVRDFRNLRAEMKGLTKTSFSNPTKVSELNRKLTGISEKMAIDVYTQMDNTVAQAIDNICVECHDTLYTGFLAEGIQLCTKAHDLASMDTLNFEQVRNTVLNIVAARTPFGPLVTNPEATKAQYKHRTEQTLWMYLKPKSKYTSLLKSISKSIWDNNGTLKGYR